MCFVLFICFFSQNSFAQYEEAKHGLAYRWNFINHEYPFNNNFTTKGIHTNGIDIVYQYHLHPNFNLAVPLKFGFVDYFEADDFNPQPETISYQALEVLGHAKWFKESALASPYLLAGLGVNLEEFTDASAVFPVGAGINFRLTRHFYISIQSEYRFSTKELRDNFTHGIGGFVLLNPKKKRKNRLDIPLPDRDEDGIPDEKDKCPTVPGLAMYSGCPDTDGDTVPDHKDQCPDVAGERDNAGCPYNSGYDDDNDGIPNDQDKCPNSAGLARFGGCPDTDGDGVSDIEDACPQLAGLPRFKGCPDTDGDGISDNEDRCPKQIGPIENKGCPKIDIADQEILDIAVQAVEFETSSAILKEASFPVLNQIVTIMNKYPAYHLTISGHTDSVGDSASNQVLSEKRAKSCYEYLKRKGVAANRMDYVGFGEKQPIADNINMAGRQQNRRVEFDIYLK